MLRRLSACVTVHIGDRGSRYLPPYLPPPDERHKGAPAIGGVIGTASPPGGDGGGNCLKF